MDKMVVAVVQREQTCRRSKNSGRRTNKRGGDVRRRQNGAGCAAFQDKTVLDVPLEDKTVLDVPLEDKTVVNTALHT